MGMLFWTYAAVCLMMAPVVLAEEGSVFAAIPRFTAQTWAGMALLTFFHNFLSMILFLKALHHLDAIQAALSNYLIAFFGLPVAALWLHEKLSAGAIFGGDFGPVWPRNEDRLPKTGRQRFDGVPLPGTSVDQRCLRVGLKRQ